MKFYLLLCTLFYYTSFSYCQDQVIDSSAIGTWEKVSDSDISNDGNYVSYKISHLQGDNNVTLVIQSLVKNWEFRYKASSIDVKFSSDSKRAYFKIPGDTLVELILGTSKVRFHNNVSSFYVYKRWLVWDINKAGISAVKFTNLERDNKLLFDSLQSYSFNPMFEKILISKIDLSRTVSLILYDLKSGKEKVLYKGQNIENIIIDKNWEKVAFTCVVDTNKHIFLYDLDSGYIRSLVSNSDLSNHELFDINGINSFTEDSKYLLFSIKKRTLPFEQGALISNIGNPNVAVWSTRNSRLKTQKSTLDDEDDDWITSVNLKTRKITRLERENYVFEGNSTDFAIMQIRSGKGTMSEREWNPASKIKHLLISLEDGIEKVFPIKGAYMSKNSRYFIYFNEKENNYYTYEIATGKIQNITMGIDTNWSMYQNDRLDSSSYVYIGSCIWLENDSSVLVRDRYDIWKLDPAGVRSPINLTRGYGRLNNTILYPIKELISDDGEKNESEKILLGGFNFKTKENGFFYLKLTLQGDLEKLTMGPYIYYAPMDWILDGGEIPKKAANKKIYIIRRMSSTSSPNYFVTENFKSFRQISRVNPETKYNWVKTTLYNYKTLDGKDAQGILYKPSNFDSSKKYPIVFYYYEQMSVNLNAFIQPQFSLGQINIPWFVSRGYLVFTPDIHYSVGEPGASAFNYVVSAANIISKLSFVDSTKMGIQGHSFGGYETNFLITHTKMFSCACTASSISDLVSYNGLIGRDGGSLQHILVKAQWRLKETFWENPQKYIRNSPYYYLSNVQTPLFIMHTKNDGNCPFPQALELFLGLRRLKKTAWMAVYENENHILLDDKNRVDFTNKMDDFFGYYLKNMPIPDWMRQLPSDM